MKPSQTCTHIVVPDNATFRRVLHEHRVEVALADEDAEAAYEALHEGLEEQLSATLAARFGKRKRDVLYHQIGDWWPTRTVFLELDSQCVTWAMIDDLRALLVGEVEDFRFNVFSPLASDDPVEVGGLNVYREWLLIQRSVYELLPQAENS